MKEKNNGSHPFFIVINNGQDVQELSEWVKGVMEKWGIDPVLEVLKSFFDMLVAGVNSYVFLEVLHDFITQLVLVLKKLLKAVDPVLAFDLFKES